MHVHKREEGRKRDRGRERERVRSKKQVHFYDCKCSDAQTLKLLANILQPFNCWPLWLFLLLCIFIQMVGAKEKDINKKKTIVRLGSILTISDANEDQNHNLYKRMY